MKLRFISGNKHKIAEVQTILGESGIEIVPVALKIEELQTEELEALVHDKCVKAYRRIGRPLIVEHTGLRIEALGGFPGGLTDIFWRKLEQQRFAELFGRGARTNVMAHTQIGYCDGRQIHQFEGEVKGTIPPEPRGPIDFQWDCVFVPDGYEESFAEMGDRKNAISMRRIALDKLATFLRGTHGDR